MHSSTEGSPTELKGAPSCFNRHRMALSGAYLKPAAIKAQVLLLKAAPKRTTKAFLRGMYFKLLQLVPVGGSLTWTLGRLGLAGMFFIFYRNTIN